MSLQHSGPEHIPRSRPAAAATRPRPGPRPRPITKCDQCRDKKSKCDAAKPCGHCLSSRISCTYSQVGPRINSRSHLIKNSESIYEKLNKLHELLKAATDTKSRNTCSDPWPSINLEIDNLPNLLSKLWLRNTPEPTFFSTRHPLIIRVRQDAFPAWVTSEDWNLWPVLPNLPPTNLTSTPLPNRTQCTQLIDLFLSSCNWYFELFTDPELKRALNNLNWVNENETLERPTTTQAWMDLALVFSACRLSLALDGWAGVVANGELARRRKEILYGLCELSVMALQQAGFEDCPSIDGMKILLTLLSTLFFETDCGVLACSAQMAKLRKIALRCAYDMSLNREMVSGDTKTDEERRKVWWGLVTVDAHFGATGSADGVIPLRESDVTFPTYPKNQPLDLLSPMSRFAMGRYNNRCCELLARRRPFATIADILEFDRDLLATEASVKEDQRIAYVGGAMTNPGGLAGYRKPIDQDVWRGQQIFYLAFWHIRSKIHRGLLFTAQTLNPTIRDRINLPLHCDIVKDSSLLLLEFYQYLQLPTAFISVIVGAAITLCLQISETPGDPRATWIISQVKVVFERLEGVRSPVIVRSRRVLEYILSITKSESGASHQAPTSQPESNASGSSMDYDSYSSVRRTDNNPVVISSGPLAALVDTSKAVENSSHHNQNIYPSEKLTRPIMNVSEGLVSSSSGWELRDSLSLQLGQDEPQHMTPAGWNALDIPLEPVPPYAVIGNSDSLLFPATPVEYSKNLVDPVTDAEVFAILGELPVMGPAPTTTADSANPYRSDHQDSVGMYATQATWPLQDTLSFTPPDFGMMLGTECGSLSSSLKSTSSADQATKDMNFLGIAGMPSSYVPSVDLTSTEGFSSKDWRLSRNTFDPGPNPGGNGFKEFLGIRRDEPLVSSSANLWEPSAAVSPCLSFGATSSINGSSGGKEDWMRRDSWEDKDLFGGVFSSSADWNVCGPELREDKGLRGLQAVIGLEDSGGSADGESGWDGHRQFWGALDEVVGR